MQQVRRGFVVDQRDAHHATTPPRDVVRPDDGVECVVGTFDENVGAQPPNQLERRVLLEQDDTIDGGERCDQAGALRLGDDRPIRSLPQPARGGIGIHTHDQGVAFPARRLEQRDVPGVQQIEDAVREDDRALGPSPGRGSLGRADLRGGVQSGCVVLGWRENAWLKNGSETHSL